MNPYTGLLVDGVQIGAGKPVSFSVAARECVALLADSGDTASFLIDRLAGHMPASGAAGRVLVDGQDVTALPPARRRIGIVSGRDPLLDHLSVRGNFAFALAARCVREPERGHRVRQALALLGLEAEADRRPADLDPAQTLRALLARALVCDPAVVLLDDPLARIDRPARGQMHLLMRRLARARGLALLLVTRDRDEALMMGERIGILAGAALRQLGTAAELLDRPSDETVAVGFGDANSLTGHVECIDDDIAQVRLGAGPSMAAMASGDLAAGAGCVVCVRPERVAVAFVAEGATLGADALAGTLADMVHLGDHVQLRFRLAGGSEVLVRRPASQPTAGLRAGRPALLAWQPAHAIAFAWSG